LEALAAFSTSAAWVLCANLDRPPCTPLAPLRCLRGVLLEGLGPLAAGLWPLSVETGGPPLREGVWPCARLTTFLDCPAALPAAGPSSPSSLRAFRLPPLAPCMHSTCFSWFPCLAFFFVSLPFLPFPFVSFCFCPFLAFPFLPFPFLLSSPFLSLRFRRLRYVSIWFFLQSAVSLYLAVAS